MKKYELIPCPSDLALANQAASEWLKNLPARSGTPYLAALSGGRIAKHFCASVAEQARGRDLTHVHWFWADERCVPPDHADSNFLLAQKHLFEPLAISPNLIHRIRGEETPPRAAELAAQELSGLATLKNQGVPVLDMVFLGMGEDGHVASLFPNGQPEPEGAIYYPVVASKPPPNRITISYNVLAVARQVWVLASGAGKEVALQESLEENGRTPLSKVIRNRPSTRIFSDIKLLSAN
jgi:6-phosphogluconolactonase